MIRFAETGTGNVSRVLKELESMHTSASAASSEAITRSIKELR